ncbi:hypothetical protein IE53DRAFT_378351 [Violaceomyces palustris]|uniref:Uncharacterized protein n=1 Tax=Violaceomyces palustris TaxID=1673888 RepID=A0ACD0P2B5_9BASI|nr:hypothetical protein IE53DRAFT_378351 [Violaceomyces palustris]
MTTTQQNRSFSTPASIPISASSSSLSSSKSPDPNSIIDPNVNNGSDQSPTRQLDQEERQSLTSFNFLQDLDQPPESSFALGNLFSRVKNALSAAAPSASTTNRDSSSSLENTAADYPSATTQHRYTRSSSNPTWGATGLGTLDEHPSAETTFPPSNHANGGGPGSNLTRVAREESIGSRFVPAPVPSSSSTIPPVSKTRTAAPSSSGSVRPTSLAGSRSASTINRSFKSPPLSLRSVAPAPAVTFTSPAHAVVSQRIYASFGDDQSSVLAEDVEPDLDSQIQVDLPSAVVVGAGSRNSGAEGSFWAAHGWSTIPGFPLSKDILADDARSIHSSSSRRPRSDFNDDPSSSSSVAIVTGPGSARAGLQTSADAIMRRMKGDGLSKKFWMADENAKECRECLTVFTSWRRKHHCRICGQIFCGRCASHIIQGTRFDYDGMVRVCNFCMRMLEEYDRHEPPVAPASSSQTARLRMAGHSGRTLRDKDMISAPLEAQIRSPQSQFAANNLFARATVAPSFGSMGMGMSSFSSGLLRRDSDEDEPFEASRSVSPMPGASTGSNKLDPPTVLSTATAVAPFRKGLTEDDLNGATTTPGEEEDGPIDFIGSALGTTTAAAEAQQNSGSPSLVAEQAPSTSTPLAFPSGGTAEENFIQAANNAFASDNNRLRLISDAAARQQSAAATAQRSRLKSKNSGTMMTNGATSSTSSSTTTKVNESYASKFQGLDKVGGGASVYQKESQAHGNQSTESLIGSRIGINPGILSSAMGPMSLSHLTLMLEQTLTRGNVPKVEEWVKVLIPLILTVVSRVKPNPRETDCMDIRHFVKVKRIPGGKPWDCEYVDGFVCSKNVATKKMARQLPLSNAKVMVLTFPLDYHRSAGQFISLEPLMAQEWEFTKILVSRVVALRPNVVVVEKAVSRLALDLLEQAGVTVVWPVKPSAIEAISRCTQADVISSIDRLALDPRLGRCASFSVETFEHASLPEKRKSFMRFEGTPKDLGCTIVLRGGSNEMLRRVKSILDLMVFVGYNLRLEEFLMRDEGACLDFDLPPHRIGGGGSRNKDRRRRLLLLEDGADEEDGITDQIEDSLRPYKETLLSASSCVSMPPPFPLARMKFENDRLRMLKARTEREEMEKILRDECRSLSSEVKREKEASISTIGQVDQGPDKDKVVVDPELDGDQAGSEEGKATEPSPDEEDQDGSQVVTPTVTVVGVEDKAVVMEAIKSISAGEQAQEGISVALATAESSTPPPASKASQHYHVQDSELVQSLRLPDQVAREAEYSLAKERHSTLLKSWRAYLDRSCDSISPFSHQRLVMLTSKICAVTLRPCSGPQLETVDYYGLGDVTLGQFLERTCRESGKICENKGCGRAGVLHFWNYVHNRTRIQVVTERFVCPIPGEENRLLSWSYCKACELATPVSAITAESWSYSFAKYLELHFYPDSRCRTQICPHGFYSDQVRYFAFQNLAIRFHSDPIEILEVRVPDAKLLVRDDLRIALKNEEALGLQLKSSRFWDSVVNRIKGLGLDPSSFCSSSGGEASSWNSTTNLVEKDASNARDRNRVLLSDMVKRCESDRREIENLLIKVYRETPASDVLSINLVRRALQEKVVRWDVDFAEYEKNCLPTEKDIRRLTTSHLKRLFVEKDPSSSAEKTSSSIMVSENVPTMGLPPAAEMDEVESSEVGEKPPTSSSNKRQDVRIPSSVSDPEKVSTNFKPSSEEQDQEIITTPKAEEKRKTSGNRKQHAPSFASYHPSKKENLDEDETDDPNESSPTESRGGGLVGGAVNSRLLFNRNSVTLPSSPVSGIGGGVRNVMDESSCTENEISGQVSNLVKRFETPRRSGGGGGGGGFAGDSESKEGGGEEEPEVAEVGDGSKIRSLNPPSSSSSSSRRPNLRRGRTEDVLSSQQTVGRKGHLTPNQGPGKKGSTEVVSTKASSTSVSRSGSPTLKLGTPSGTRNPRMRRVDSNGGGLGGGRRNNSASGGKNIDTGPPSSFRPPKNPTTAPAAAAGASRLGQRPVMVTRSTSYQRGVSVGRYTSDSDRERNFTHLVPPTHLSSREPSSSAVLKSGGGGGSSQQQSRLPISSTRREMAASSSSSTSNHHSKNRVSMIAKHFDRINKEAERQRDRDRERQHRQILSLRSRNVSSSLASSSSPSSSHGGLGWRARPVAMTRAKVEVFNSVKEAVRDDESESECGGDNVGEDDGDGDVDDDDDDEEEEDDEEDEEVSIVVDVDTDKFDSRMGKRVIKSSTKGGKPNEGDDDQGQTKPAHDEHGNDTIKMRSGKKNKAPGDEDGDKDEGQVVVDARKTVLESNVDEGGRDEEKLPDVNAGIRTMNSELESDAQSITAPSISNHYGGKTLLANQLGGGGGAGGLFSDSDSVTANSGGGGGTNSNYANNNNVGGGLGFERNSLLKTLSGLWAFRSGDMMPLEYPLSNSEHVFSDSHVIVREDEPSSIIAFTLSSKNYDERLRNMQKRGSSRLSREREEAAASSVVPTPGASGGGFEASADAPWNQARSKNHVADVSSGIDKDPWGMIDLEGAEMESALKRPEGTHFRYEFESGTTRLWCKILFAEQFDALRRSCGCETSFIESLSRCVKWDSSGGKSGSAFLKTKDDRLVVKQLSRFEMDNFSKFAPHYFSYMAQCFFRQRPTTLAKIFGCFRIGFRNPQTGRSLKMDCLVMENLFYGREMSKIFDLKGSMRNRHIQETGRANEVLLDENLVEISTQSPLFVREHSKRLLRAALWNDSLFLADMNVMDYSLVVGLDRSCCRDEKRMTKTTIQQPPPPPPPPPPPDQSKERSEEKKGKEASHPPPPQEVEATKPGTCTSTSSWPSSYLDKEERQGVEEQGEEGKDQEEEEEGKVGPELVVGIIDFVRTFTWDKRVESFVKESSTTLLGGGGKGEPTIITPRQYRTRFLSFLDKSLLITPDLWIDRAWSQ